MKFLLLYSDKKKINFPTPKELKQEFNCAYVSDLKDIKKDFSKNIEWKNVNQEVIESFIETFIRFHSSSVNSLWSFDTSRTSYAGECAAYLLSNDIDKRVIDWWSMKHSLTIRTFQCTDSQLNEAMDYCYASNAIEQAHQYSSAEHCRSQVLRDYLNNLTKPEIAYLESLTEQENKIRLKFQKISKNMIKKAQKLVKKNF